MTFGKINQSAGPVDASVPDTPLGIGFMAAGAPGALRYTNGVATELRAVGYPYNAREIGKTLEEIYLDQVNSSTLPNLTDKNVGHAGKRHSVSRIVFDSRDFPILIVDARASAHLVRYLACSKCVVKTCSRRCGT